MSRAVGRELAAFVVPDARMARTVGLDLRAAGLRPVATPRHASVLLLIGDLPAGLARASAIAYAQMPRPRALLVAGAERILGLPVPDVRVPLDQGELARGVARLRGLIASGGWLPDPASFEPPVAAEAAVGPKVGAEHDHSAHVHGSSHEAAPAGAAAEHSAHAGHRAPERDAHRGHDAPSSRPLAASPGTGDPEPDAASATGEAAVVPRVGQGHDHGHQSSPSADAVHHHPVTEHSESAAGAAPPPHAMHHAPPAVDRGRTRSEHAVHRTHGEHADDHVAGASGVDASQASHDAGSDKEPGVHHHAMHAGVRVGAELGPGRSHEDASPGAAAYATMGHETIPGADTAEHTAMDHSTVDRAVMGHPGMHGAAPSDPTRNHAEMGHVPSRAMAADHATMHHGASDHAATGHTEADHPGIEPPGTAPPAVDHAGMDHSMMGHDMAGTDHSAHMMGGFMSMVALTQDLPRSADGLPMEWLDIPFGPLFPGLPGGLGLSLTLDGDGVARAALDPGAIGRGPGTEWPGPAGTFPDRLARLDPLAAASYRVLALRGLAAIHSDHGQGQGHAPPGWIGALERERAASHLGWLAEIGQQVGAAWMADEAATRQLALVRATTADEITRLAPDIRRFLRAVRRVPMLRRRLAGIGMLSPGPTDTRGPVARGGGIALDSRAGDPAYGATGFVPSVADGGDALARFRVRLAEIEQSLDLVARAGDINVPSIVLPPGISGVGMAAVETPRGAVFLHVEVTDGAVTAAHVDPPSKRHAALIPEVAEGLEIADALVGIASLDLSPWEIAA